MRKLLLATTALLALAAVTPQTPLFCEPRWEITPASQHRPFLQLGERRNFC